MPNPVEVIEHEGTTVAIVIRNSGSFDSSGFFTSADLPLQLGVVKNSATEVVEKHSHPKVNLEQANIIEILVVRRGQIKVTLFAGDQIVLTSILNAGEVIWINQLAHRIDFLSDSEIIEIKQGPYAAK